MLKILKEGLVVVVEVLLYVHRNRRLIRDGGLLGISSPWYNRHGWLGVKKTKVALGRFRSPPVPFRAGDSRWALNTSHTLLSRFSRLCSCHATGNKRHAGSVTRGAWVKFCQGSSRGRRQAWRCTGKDICHGWSNDRPAGRVPSALPPLGPPPPPLDPLPPRPALFYKALTHLTRIRIRDGFWCFCLCNLTPSTRA